MAVAGKPGELARVRKVDIKVPQQFQRALNRNRAKRIADKFNWFQFGVLTLANINGEYYVVDGQHRHAASLLIDEIDMVPCMLYDFDGLEHAAQIFVKLQICRKPLVTRDQHNAELFAGGEFGRLAGLAQRFIDNLACETVPLSTIRQLWKRHPDAFERVADLVTVVAGTGALRKDFIEAVVTLEAMLLVEGGGTLSLNAEDWRRTMFELGQERIVAEMTAYLHGQQTGTAKIASPRMKAEALRHILRSGISEMAA